MISLTIENQVPDFDTYNAPVVGRGSSGTVFEINKYLVFKCFTEDEDGRGDFERETSIYQDLGSGESSQNIISLNSVMADGLVLERHGCSLRLHLKMNPQRPDRLRMKWALNCSQALQFLHQKGIMHGDLGCHNFLVNESDCIKLCDFAGSARKGESARICYEARARHPDYKDGRPTTETEIFSLGSTIFEIFTSQAPYASEPVSVVRQRYSQRKFPLFSIQDLRVRKIVRKCWTSEYRHVAEVCDDLSSADEDSSQSPSN